MLVVAIALIGAGGTIACGGGPPPVSSAVSAANTTADEASLMEHHRYHHLGGLTLFIAMSADTLGVPSEQRAAVEKIRKDLQARMEPSHVAEHNLLTTLADGLGAGNVDAEKVDAAVAQLTLAAAAVHDASADALNDLHHGLTADQRATLVDKAESHWAIWQKANAGRTGAVAGDDRGLAALGTDLHLTADQLTKIRAGLSTELKGAPRINLQEITAQLHAFGDAFRNDTFDARALATAGEANAQMARWGAAQVARFVETVVSVLTLDQRVKLASRLREHAAYDMAAREHP